MKKTLIDNIRENCNGLRIIREHEILSPCEKHNVVYNVLTPSDGSVETVCDEFTITVGTLVTKTKTTDNVTSDLMNEATSNMTHHITGRLFSHGWYNHVKLVREAGEWYNLNMSFDEMSGENTPSFAYNKIEDNADEHGNYISYHNESLPYIFMSNVNVKNTEEVYESIVSNIESASEIIKRLTGHEATFIVTNMRVLGLIMQSDKFRQTNALSNANKTDLQCQGQIGDIYVYLDPLMAIHDTRVLVGRVVEEHEEGAHIWTYSCETEPVVKKDDETETNETVMKTRYALKDCGKHPENSFYTFSVAL